MRGRASYDSLAGGAPRTARRGQLARRSGVDAMLRAVPGSHPIFGRDVPDAAWRPGHDLLRESRLAGFLAATGAPNLDALHRHAVHDPGRVWGSAAADLQLAWPRRPRA